MADDLNSIFGDVGGAVADLFDAQGAATSASSYRTAAGFSGLNASLEEQATAIKTVQAQREGYLGIGQEHAQIAGAGFSDSGSALDLLRAAHQQSALQQGAIQLQGAIDVNSYKQQQSAELSQATSADEAQQGDTIGGILKGIGAVAGIAALFI